MEDLRRFAVIVSADGEKIEVAGGDAEGMAFGTARLLDGPHRGERFVVVEAAGRAMRLREAPRWPIEPGMRLELVEGCDKTFATCVARFDNARNFRGEPHLPGSDLLTRYPGA